MGDDADRVELLIKWNAGEMESMLCVNLHRELASRRDYKYPRYNKGWIVISRLIGTGEGVRLLLFIYK